MSSIPYYPTTWPYKGAVYSGLDTNEDVVPVLLVVLDNAIEFWKQQEIEGDEMASLLRQSQFVLNRGKRAYEDDRFLTADDQYRLVAKLSDTLDRLAPEGLYFGQHPSAYDVYGFYSADTLSRPYTLAA